MIAGVAAGLANYLEIDPTFVRLAFLLGLFTTGPVAVLVYLACMFIMPREPHITYF